MYTPDFTKDIHVAGKANWAWNWMGFSAPGFMPSYGSAIPVEYLPFKHTFGEHFGIGEGTHWNRAELAAMPDEKKIELIKLLLSTHNHISTCHRKYVGLNEDGTLNKSIPPHIDRYGPFWAFITPEQCRQEKYPHNQRHRKQDGYYCFACNGWIAADTEEYKATEKS